MFVRFGPINYDGFFCINLPIGSEVEACMLRCRDNGGWRGAFSDWFFALHCETLCFCYSYRKAVLMLLLLPCNKLLKDKPLEPQYNKSQSYTHYTGSDYSSKFLLTNYWSGAQVSAQLVVQCLRLWQRWIPGKAAAYVTASSACACHLVSSLLAAKANLCGQRAGIDKTWSLSVAPPQHTVTHS